MGGFNKLWYAFNFGRMTRLKAVNVPVLFELVFGPFPYQVNCVLKPVCNQQAQ